MLNNILLRVLVGFPLTAAIPLVLKVLMYSSVKKDEVTQREPLCCSANSTATKFVNETIRVAGRVKSARELTNAGHSLQFRLQN